MTFIAATSSKCGPGAPSRSILVGEYFGISEGVILDVALQFAMEANFLNATAQMRCRLNYDHSSEFSVLEPDGESIGRNMHTSWCITFTGARIAAASRSSVAFMLSNARSYIASKHLPSPANRPRE